MLFVNCTVWKSELIFFGGVLVLEFCCFSSTNVCRCPSPFEMKTCRFGAGTEKTAGARDTPGFPLIDEPWLEETNAGFKKLRMPRNNKKVTQCSTDALRSWRGNCDVQVFVYESDPNHIDPNEIARVTDYTVGYSCKGHIKQKDERDQIISFVNNYTEVTGDRYDITTLSRQLLNKAATNRVISKPESLVLLLNLDLVKCTDRFDQIATNGKVRLRLKQPKRKTKDIQDLYANRCLTNLVIKTMTLHQFYHW